MTERVEAVIDDELLWRRVHPTHYVADGSGGMKVSSAAFKDPELSVDRATLVIRSGGDHTVTRQDGVGVAEFQAGFARSIGQTVSEDPLAENLAHALVQGEKDRGGKKAAKRQLAMEARFIP